VLARKHVVVSGRVQGVFFRGHAQREAMALGLKGWVKNRPDGRVEAVVEGDATAVSEMLRWFHQGSPMSRVDAVEVKDETPTGEFRDFRVTF